MTHTFYVEREVMLRTALQKMAVYSFSRLEKIFQRADYCTSGHTDTPKGYLQMAADMLRSINCKFNDRDIKVVADLLRNTMYNRNIQMYRLDVNENKFMTSFSHEGSVHSFAQ